MSTVEELVVEHAAWIHCMARYYFKNPQDADDLAGETIFKCLINNRRFDTARAFKPWVKTIMENTYITLYNRRRCVLFTSITEYEECHGGVRADQRAAINHILSVMRACARKSNNIECVMLYAKGYTYEEIADMVGIPVGTVRSRIANGRLALKQTLKY